MLHFRSGKLINTIQILHLAFTHLQFTYFDTNNILPVQENVEKDLFEDLARVLKTIKSSPKFQSAKRSPSVLELLSLEAKDVDSVWERFQFSITKAEMYSRDSPDIQPVLDSMRSLPIVGKFWFSR